MTLAGDTEQAPHLVRVGSMRDGDQIRGASWPEFIRRLCVDITDAEVDEICRTACVVPASTAALRRHIAATLSRVRGVPVEFVEER